jgi:deoxyadenosine/deoxycytidine kinase
LHKSTQNLQNQIAKRGRNYEQNIPDDYLEKISQAYFSYFKQQSEFPVLIIDTNQIDFVNDRNHYEKLCSLILENEYKYGITRLIM